MREFEDDAQVAQRYTQGTTTRPRDVRVLAISADKTKALVKHPGGMTSSGFGGAYISAWVDLVSIRPNGELTKKEVWNCSLEGDGRLTPKKIAALVQELLETS
jgi:hypothetical protein